MEKAPTKAFSWLKAATNTFTFKQEKALVGAFSVIVKSSDSLRFKLYCPLSAVLSLVTETLSCEANKTFPRTHRGTNNGMIMLLFN